MDFLFDYGNALVFFAFGIFFVILNWGVGVLIRPKNSTAEKRAVYECGEPTIGDSWGKFNIRMWTVALVFVIFDVEVIFMIPILMNLKEFAAAGTGWLVFCELLVFLAVLVVGLWYVWTKGDLEFAWPNTDDLDDLPDYVPYDAVEEEYHPPVSAGHH